MAVTKIKPVKSTLSKALDYIENPDKTDGKMLISSFGCSYETADIEFGYTLSQALDKGIRDKNIRSKHRKRVPTSVFSPSRAAARRLKMACWEVSQTLGTERKGAKQWTDGKGRCKSNSE